MLRRLLLLVVVPLVCLRPPLSAAPASTGSDLVSPRWAAGAGEFRGPAAGRGPRGEGTRVSVPTATQQAAARCDHMHDTYRADFAHKDAASMLALAQRLIANAASANDDAMRQAASARRFDLAQRVDDARTVVDAIDAMAQRFRVLDATLKATALTAICRDIHDTEQGMRFLDACMPFLASQVRIDAYEKIEPLLTQSENLARSITSGARRRP